MTKNKKNGCLVRVWGLVWLDSGVWFGWILGFGLVGFWGLVGVWLFGVNSL